MPYKRSLSLLLLLTAFVPLPALPQNPPSSPQPTAASNLPPVAPPEPAEAEIPVANPARPTVSNPATLPPVGYLQFEQGFVQANTSPDALSRQFSLTQTIKLAVASRLMATFSWQPVAVTQQAASDPSAASSTDFGDLQSSVQAILVNGSERVPTLALSYARRLRAGTSPDLDIGAFSQSAVVYLSGNNHRFHYDSNFVFNEQIESRPVSSDLRRAQYGQTLSVSHEVFAHRFHDNLGLGAELWHFTQPLVFDTVHGSSNLRSNAVGFLTSAAYSLRPNLVLDAGFDHGLTSTSTAWQGFAGFTYLFPHRLWR